MKSPNYLTSRTWNAASAVILWLRCHIRKGVLLSRHLSLQKVFPIIFIKKNSRQFLNKSPCPVIFLLPKCIFHHLSSKSLYPKLFIAKGHVFSRIILPPLSYFSRHFSIFFVGQFLQDKFISGQVLAIFRPSSLGQIFSVIIFFP